MLQGLSPPFLTEADPAQAGEGSIDPLGLAPLSERLAEEIAPWVTARMQRIRFVTAIAATSVATQGLEDIPPADGVTPPYLACEWHIIEGFGRFKGLDASAGFGVPGISKARSVVARSGHLDATNYLKAPKVFGFHGIYKRLARGMGVVDDDLMLGERGEQLVRAWEADQDLDGFIARKPNTPGGKLARRLADATYRTLVEGQIQERPRSHLWWQVVHHFRPDQPGERERALLWEWLTEEDAPTRRELVLALEEHGPTDTEAAALRAIRDRASEPLAVRLEAIDAYERLARILTAAFNTIRYSSTTEGTVTRDLLAAQPLIAQATGDLQVAFRTATAALATLGLDHDLESMLGDFASLATPRELVDVFLAHHERIQANRPPGKRPWLEEVPGGLRVRLPYRVDDAPTLDAPYVHPYRVFAIRRFIEDLR